MPNDLTPTPDLTKTPDPSLISGEQKVPEFVPDTTKTAEENAAAKTAFETAANEKAAADKIETEKKAAEAAKTEAEKKAADEIKAKNDTKATPLTLEEIKLPDGFQIDEPIAKSFVEIVNKHGIPRDVVAELTTLQATAMKSVSEAGNKLYSDMQETWRTEARNDPTIGGEKLAPTLGNVAKVVDHYGSPELRGVFDLTGAGNNPHVIKFLSKIYEDLGEAKFIPSNQPAGGQKSQADTLYPNQGKT